MNSLLALALYALSATKTMAADYVLGTRDVRAERQFDLTNRYPVQSVSDVFRDNILLTLAYMNGNVTKKSNINWDEIRKPQSYSLTIPAGGTFAFHENVLPEFKNKDIVTMGAHFNGEDGFRSDGYLTGDGVCHLASLMYWAALNAGLTAKAPVNHNFATIPEVPKEYGVSILYTPDGSRNSANQNLYITNTFDTPAVFEFTWDGTNLSLSIVTD